MGGNLMLLLGVLPLLRRSLLPQEPEVGKNEPMNAINPPRSSPDPCGHCLTFILSFTLSCDGLLICPGCFCASPLETAVSPSHAPGLE